MNVAYDLVLNALNDAGKKIEPAANGAKAQCPAHEDRNPSLSITKGTGRVLAYCHAGCDTNDVLAELGLSPADMFDEKSEKYRYDDGREVLRTYEGGRKHFVQAGNRAATPTLFGLAKVVEAVAAGKPVYLVEGEKDVLTLRDAGVCATTAPMGATNFDKVDVGPLRGATVIAIVDKDAAGAKWAQEVTRRLDGWAAALTLVQAATGKDATDHIAAGRQIAELEPFAVGKPSASVIEEPTPNCPEELFYERESLIAIHDWAKTRLVGPWAVLGAVLAQVCTRIGPHVMLPAIVGTRASLNTCWALVGASGQGKDAAIGVAGELIGKDSRISRHEAGTGQGIDAGYVTNTGQGVIQTCDSILWTITEIDTLAAHGRQNGSTIMPTLRKLFTGSQLGAHYADESKRRTIADHSYRAAVIAGVQPARAGVLLDDADGGTPQRWVWLPTGDPMAAVYDYPTEPLDWRVGDRLSPVGSIKVNKLAEEHHPIGRKADLEVKVCDTARMAIIAARIAVMCGETPAGGLDGHALLTRLKVAALLGFLERRDSELPEVTEEDWALAGTVMAKSTETRTACEAALKDVSRAQVAERAEERVDMAAYEEDVKTKRVADRIVTFLRKKHDEGAEWVKAPDARRAQRAALREQFDPVLASMLASGGVVANEEVNSRGDTVLYLKLAGNRSSGVPVYRCTGVPVYTDREVVHRTPVTENTI